MSDSIEKIKLDSAITVSFYKHRGDIGAIATELDLPFDYIKKIVNKLKVRMKRDVSLYLSVAIMQTIWTGYQQRTAYLNTCLSQLKGKESADVSLCCRAPVKLKEEGTAMNYYCLKCNSRAHAQRIEKGEIYSLIMNFTNALREEDKTLMDFADKMGFTFAEKPPIIQEGPTFVFNELNVSPDDKGVIKKLEGLTPVERERIRKKIEKGELSNRE